MAKQLDLVHQDVEDRETQMAALTKALTEAGMGLRCVPVVVLNFAKSRTLVLLTIVSIDPPYGR